MTTNIANNNPGSRLIFSCSGAADVGLVADMAARQLTRQGEGRMYCLAGVGGRVEGILATTAEAEELLAIDGCPQQCAASCLKQAGFTRFKHLALADMGFAKGVTEPSTATVDKVVEAARSLLHTA